ncbi:MAG: glycosyltransferase family 9 protein [Deltaproteobacteria bacterium]|nr:glycosyltransferase family 9 protein [Deltaproteobacteria bacterium]
MGKEDFTKGFRKILVVRNDNLGDVICTTPAIEALRKTFPDAYIAVLVADYTREALEGNPFIDRLYSYEKAKHSRRMRLAAWWMQAHVMREIRRERFDVAIGIRSRFTTSNAWLVYLSRAPVRVGRRPGGKGGVFSFFFNVYVDAEVAGRHEVQRSLDAVRCIGADIDHKRLTFYIPADALSEADSFIRENGLGRGRHLVVVHIARRVEEGRYWPPENYAAVVNALMENDDVDVVMNWLEKDDGHAKDVMVGLKRMPFVFRTTTLKTFAALLSRADLLLTIEGGAMHIGAAVGAPTVVIFGKSPVSVWHPWCRNYVALKNGNRESSVGADEVIEAARRLLYARETYEGR